MCLILYMVKAGVFSGLFVIFKDVFFKRNIQTLKKKGCHRQPFLTLKLFEVLWTSFCAFAFTAFCNISKSSVFKHSFHYDFTLTIRTNEFLCCNGCTRVFTGSCHLYNLQSIGYNIIKIIKYVVKWRSSDFKEHFKKLRLLFSIDKCGRFLLIFITVFELGVILWLEIKHQLRKLLSRAKLDACTIRQSRVNAVHLQDSLLKHVRQKIRQLHRLS